MNHKQMRFNYEKKKLEEYDYTPKRAQQERFSERPEDFVWEIEIRKVISPSRAGRELSGHVPDREEL